MKFQKLILKTSIFIVVAILILALVFLVFVNSLNLNYKIPILFVFSLLSTYLILRFNLKRFFFLQLKNISQSTFFENEPSFKKNFFENNFENFMEQIKEFAQNKHQEIEKLHNRDDFRKEFLGNVSHELKTPIFTAQGYLLTLLDDDFDNEVLHKKYLERANKSIDRLNFIVKDLDLISKLESGMELNFESFNIVKLITDVIDLLEIKASKKNITLRFDKVYDYPILVEADKKRIEQVLTNLIANSINYSANGGQTIISLNSYHLDVLTINIKDNGIGILPMDLPRLFERFYRVDKSRSREQGGSGLGLAIVKHIIEAHQQEVVVKSEFKKGSSFSFTLTKTN